jgi:hypothetical protein
MQAIARKFWQVEGPPWPAIPWYELPHFYRENRAKLMKHNDNFVFSGCWVIAREHLFKPVFIPVHLTA